jgi:15-cis-phytoene synthase
LAYAAARLREPLTALFLIDQHLARIALGARESMVARIKLAWWREHGFARGSGDLALELETLASASDKSLALLGRIAEGWDALMAGDNDKAQMLTNYAKGRGQGLFELAIHLARAKATSEMSVAGEAWALSDVSHRLSDTHLAQIAGSKARACFADIPRTGLSSLPLPLGILAILARSDTTRSNESEWRPGSPVRMGRALWFAISKR